jgi:hypothetical protein
LLDRVAVIVEILSISGVPFGNNNSRVSPTLEAAGVPVSFITSLQILLFPSPLGGRGTV